jgi:chromosome partitioning protein
MAAKIVAVANLKGGVGKSHLVTNLSAAAQATGIATAILDIDADQQFSARWSDRREAATPLVISPVYSRLPQAVDELSSRGLEFILIDCAAKTIHETERAVEIADLVLIPTRASLGDLQYVEATINITTAKNKPRAVILNFVERTRETGEALSYLKHLGVAVIPVHLSKAVAFNRAAAAALGVTEYEPGCKSAQEIRGVLEWVSGLLELPSGKDVSENEVRRLNAA